MSEAAQQLLEQIRALPDADREWLVGELGDEDDATDADIEESENGPEFQAMLAERLHFAANRPNELLDGDEVTAEARRRLKERRG
jgi:hypothetical protein